MIKKELRRVASLMCLCVLSGLMTMTYAQHNTSSPYTRYGYGNIIDGGYGQSRAMGGLSYGVRPSQYINAVNPASYTSIDSLTFRFEAGASFQISDQKGSGVRSTSLNGNLEFLAFQFAIRKWVAFSVGLQPVSVVGYEFSQTEEGYSSISSGTLTTKYEYSGEGGVTQLYAGLGFKPFKWLAVGGNFQFNFGTISHSSKSTFSISSYHATAMTQEISIKDISGNFGLQAMIPLKENHNLTVGAVYQMKSSLNADATQTIITTDTTTLSYDNQFDLPMHIGVGVVYSYTDALMVGIDYKREFWNDVRFFGEKNFYNRDKFIVGMQYLPDANGRAYFQRVAYRFGVNYSKSYYSVNGEQLNSFSLTTGWGFPLKRGLNPTRINVTFEYGHNGVVSDTQIREQYFKFTLNATINERWFEKRKLN